MKPVGPVLLAIVGLVLGWIALAADSPSYDPPERVVPTTIPVSLSGTMPLGHVVRTFDIDGVCCEGCVGKLYGALQDLAGVREAAVDPVHSRAVAVVPLDFDVALLEDALTFDKYTAHLANTAE